MDTTSLLTDESSHCLIMKIAAVPGLLVYDLLSSVLYEEYYPCPPTKKSVSHYNFQKGDDDRHRQMLDDFVAFKIKHCNDKY